MAETPTHAGADVISAAGALSNEEVADQLDLAFRDKAAAEGKIVVLLGEASRRQLFRDEGATATEPWAVERFGISIPTARTLTRVGEVAWDLPHLVGSLCEGEVSLDKVKVLAEVATPESDEGWRDQAQEHSVRELGEVARASAPPALRASRRAVLSTTGATCASTRRSAP